MIAIARALYAELLKTKRTLALLLAFLAPLSIALLVFVMYFQRNTPLVEVNANIWIRMISNAMVMWGLLMLPLFVTLETGLLNALEHGNKMWKQIFALPIPRWSVYIAKQLIALALIGLSMAILLVLLVIVGVLLSWLKPDFGFSAPIPWQTLIECIFLAYLAAWLIIALHFWVSAHWSNFVVAMGVGIVATVAGVMIVNSEWVTWYPWTLPGFVAINYLDNKLSGTVILFGFLGGIVMSVMGAWETNRPDVV